MLTYLIGRTIYYRFFIAYAVCSAMYALGDIIPSLKERDGTNIISGSIIQPYYVLLMYSVKA